MRFALIETKLPKQRKLFTVHVVADVTAFAKKDDAAPTCIADLTAAARASGSGLSIGDVSSQPDGIPHRVRKLRAYGNESRRDEAVTGGLAVFMWSV